MKKTEDANKRIAKQAAASKSMESPWRLAMKRLSRNKLAIAGLIFLGVMIVLCIGRAAGKVVHPCCRGVRSGPFKSLAARSYRSSPGTMKGLVLSGASME